MAGLACATTGAVSSPSWLPTNSERDGTQFYADTTNCLGITRKAGRFHEYEHDKRRLQLLGAFLPKECHEKAAHAAGAQT